MLTMEQWGTSGVVPSQHEPYLMRLEHIYERDEDESMSTNVTLSLHVSICNKEIVDKYELSIFSEASKRQSRQITRTCPQTPVWCTDIRVHFRAKLYIPNQWFCLLLNKIIASVSQSNGRTPTSCMGKLQFNYGWSQIKDLKLILVPFSNVRHMKGQYDNKIPMLISTYEHLTNLYGAGRSGDL